MVESLANVNLLQDLLGQSSTYILSKLYYDRLLTNFLMLDNSSSS